MANRFDGMLERYRWLRAALLACACTVAVACGDDSTETSDDDAVVPACTPGRTETGCTCSASQPPGSRHCDPDGVWEPCVCPPPGSDQRCTPGKEVLCFPCPGEREGRRTTCLSSGTFDCDCPRDGGRPSDDDDAGR